MPCKSVGHSGRPRHPHSTGQELTASLARRGSDGWIQDGYGEPVACDGRNAAGWGGHARMRAAAAPARVCRAQVLAGAAPMLPHFSRPECRVTTPSKNKTTTST